MQLEAISDPIVYRLRSGEEIVLRPGVPTELPEPAAKQLLQKAPDKVRQVSYATVEAGQEITWQGADLTIRCGTIDFLHTDDDRKRWAFVTCHDGNWAAVNIQYASIVDVRAPA